ncbi:MAG: peptidoglycan-binding protein [Parasporobacterium sp.]|nr:peptidoglycan-binding protein [Parasporobacterium sp.]
MKYRIQKIVTSVLAALLALTLIVPVTGYAQEFVDGEEAALFAGQETSDGSLVPGMYGEDVLQIQEVLYYLQYLAYAPDGYYGPVTEQAVIAFQSDYGLYVDGVVGPMTYGALMAAAQAPVVSFHEDPAAEEAVLEDPAAEGTDQEDPAQQDAEEPGISEGAGEIPSLALGSTGDAVIRVQQALADLGYLDSAIDGYYGPVTESAVLAFQNANGLYVDGVAGPMTQDALFAGTAVPALGGESKAPGEETEETSKPAGQTDYEYLMIGSAGEAVVRLQKTLKELGYLDAPADGDYGQYTASAVSAFQQANGLYVDGEAGPMTQAVLYSEDAEEVPEVSLEGTETLTIGSEGEKVRLLQEALAELGYLDVPADGVYGQYTADAVAAFQKANGIYADGEAGSFTITTLLSDPISYSDYRANVVVEYGGTYVISSALGSSVLDVLYASTSDGANVQLADNAAAGSQKWVMQNAGGGYYHIRNLRSWKVLDGVDGNVQQSEENGSSSQLWKIVRQEDGSCQFINAEGVYLTAVSPESGANVSGAAGEETEGEAKTSAPEGTSWYLEEVDPGTALDFKVDGTQYLGIRTFNISEGNVTETSGYYNIQTDINLPSGGYYLSGGSNYSIGLKVMYVNSFLASAGYLSWDYYNYNRYDGATVWAVQQFQYDSGLPADGVTDLATWLAMGYSEYDYYNLGAYTTDLKVYAYGSDRSTYVNAMLNTAYEYAAAGTYFADGASGKPGTYVDCSGLIFQCLYAAGIDPDVNIIDHARVVYEYTSNYLGNDWQMGVAVSYAQPGDLIFYGGSAINHVAIYAGNGMIYDSWPGIGVSYRSMYSGGNILKIVRVF